MLYGIERIDELKIKLKDKTVGLVQNQASVTHEGRTTVDVIKEFCSVKTLFALEHGIRGLFKAGEDVKKEDGVDDIPVISLYHGDGSSLDKNDIQDLDAIVYDVQDLGLRFYTYVASLKILEEDCYKHDIELIVLDRPCPFGRKVWGNILSSDSFSFVGPDKLTISYGMTPGEIAIWFAKQKGHTLPTVIKLESWDQSPYWQSSWNWIKPSPNIPNFETAFIYSGLCFIEGCSLSEGRGTTKPFKTFGAPWIDSTTLLNKLKDYQLLGFTFKGIDFSPIDSKHKGKLCHGIEIGVTNYEAAEPVKLGLILLSICFSTWEETEVLPSANGLTHMDKLIGKGNLPIIISNPLKVYEEWKKDAKEFEKGRVKIYG